MAWKSREQYVVEQQIGTVSSTPKAELGYVIRASDPDKGGGEFIYLKGVASTAVGSLVIYNTADYTTTLCPSTANLGQPVAVATAATVADTYGWYQIGGVATVKKTAVEVTANQPVFISGTAGSVYVTPAAGKQILGARTANAGTVADSVGTIDVLLSRPILQGQDATA